MEIVINKAIVIFNADNSTGIPEEAFEIELPRYEHDSESVIQLVNDLIALYQDFSETGITVFLQDTKENKSYFSDGTEIK